MLSTELFSFFFHLIPFLTCEALLIIFSALTSNGLKTTTTTSKRNIPYSNKKWNYMGFCSQAQKVQVCHMIPRQSLRVEGLSNNFQLLLFVVRWSMAMQISRNKRIFYIRKEFNHHSILLVSLRSRRRKRLGIERKGCTKNTPSWLPFHRFVHQYGRHDVIWKRSTVLLQCMPVSYLI